MMIDPPIGELLEESGLPLHPGRGGRQARP